jgi:hypothetical protein
MVNRRSVVVRLMLRLLALALFSGSALVVSASRADAATCWDTDCDGRWPDETSCNNDGYTLKSASIPVFWPPSNQWVSGGTVAVMFSPSCRSQWTLIYAPQCVDSNGWVCPSRLEIDRWAQGSYRALHLGGRLYGFRYNSPWFWTQMVGADSAQATSTGCVATRGTVGDTTCVSMTA